MIKCSWPFLLAAIFLVGAFVFSFQPNEFITVTAGGVKTYCDSDSWALKNLQIQDVEVVEWGPHLEFAKKLVTVRTPFILKNTIVSHWKAMESWSQPDYLAQHSSLKTLLDVKVSESGTMTDHNEGRLLTPLLKSGPPQPTHRVINISSTDFFHKIVDPNEKLFHYYYGKVDLELKKDLMPNLLIWVLPDDANANELYLWLGGPGIGPTLHYDMDHNFFVQMVGRKRFLLIPPWQSKLVYPNPSLHHYDRKSQVDWETPDLNKFPRFQNVTLYSAYLEPGDLLYIPPFWWHKVHSLTPSASLSALSTSGVFQAMKPLYKRNLTLDLLDGEEQMVGLIVFMQEVLEALFGTDSGISELFATRWEPIKNDFHFRSIDCPDSSTQHFDSKEFMDDLDFVVASFFQTQTWYGAPLDPKRRDMNGIMEIEVLDWIEVTTASIIPIDQVYSFIKHCIFEIK